MLDNIQGNLPKHYRSLDILRGVAILLVLIYHSFIIRPTSKIDDTFFLISNSLWIGVDLFFVISGFLITGILLDSKNKKGFFKLFWLKRILRIFPLYYCVVAFAIFVAPRINFLSHFPNFSDNQWWYWTYLSNFHAIKVGSLKHQILSPTWSLAIEEQFYLLWPIVVYFLSRRKLALLSIITLLSCFTLRNYLFQKGYNAHFMYVSTFTRIDGIAVGSLIACLIREKNGLESLYKFTKYLSAIVFPALIYFFINGDLNRKHAFVVKYGYSLIALFFGLVLVWFLSFEILKRRTIKEPSNNILMKFILLLSKHSYAIYLLNRPLVNLINDHIFRAQAYPRLYGSSISGQLVFTCALIGLSLIGSILTWHIIEKPFLNLKHKLTTSNKKSTIISNDFFLGLFSQNRLRKVYAQIMP